MIKVNLAGERKKAPGRSKSMPKFQFEMPSTFTPILLLLIALGFAGGGYWWYRSLSSEAEDLNSKIARLEARRVELEAVIKQNQVFETRKKMLENRVKVIEGLQKNQLSPVIVLDQLAQAVERTQYVWLASLDQKDSVLSMTGTGTSLGAIADFYTNLYATGYFRSVDLGQSQEAGGNYTFSLKCEFAPPRGPAAAVQQPAQPAQQAKAGGN
jgi:type IV pilus assembly protein PilN